MDDFIFPPGTPEEMQQQIKTMVDRQKMAATVAKQQISRLFKEVTDDQLETLAHLFHTVVENPAAALFYEGFAKALLATRTDVWPGWDENDSVATVGFGEDGASVDIDLTVLSTPLADKPEDPLHIEREIDDIHSGIDHDALMNEYDLQVSTENPGRLQCKGCGIEYISLEDRMLRPAGPGGCNGCQQKARWG